ncbi:MAG: sporulation protein YqfD [Lachnospiraceae bacterium]|nr:sporulation protein YqfD [Lachnospiraceae bacterium]
MVLRLLRRLFFIEHHLRIEGDHVERFINLCAKNDIQLEEIRRTEENVQAVAIGFCEPKIKELADKAGVAVSVTQKSGLLYRFLLYRCRIVFYLMPLVILIALWVLSGYIWSVQVSGNRFITTDVLYDYLIEQDWYYGDKISNIIPDEMEEQLRARFPIITWCNVVVKGTCLMIDIKENELAGAQTGKYQQYNMDGYGDMAALEQGTVASIVTRAGIPQCKPGDSVSQGQILVSGEIPIYNNTGDTVIDYRYVAADADIMLQYEISYLDFVSSEVCVKEYTGASKESSFITTQLGEWKIGTQDAPYETFDHYSSCYQLRCMDNFYLPCYYGKIEYLETTFHNIYRDDQQVREILMADYDDYLEELKAAGIEVISDEIQYIPGVQGTYLSGRLMICAPGGVFVPMENPAVIDTGTD